MFLQALDNYIEFMNETPYTGFVVPNYLEPTICFTTAKLKISEQYPLEQLPVSELVKKDQVLAEFTEDDFSQSERLPRRSLRAGANTYLSEDKNQLLAAATGYPIVEFSSLEENDEKVLTVSIDPLFHLSEDRMEASILIKPLLYNYTGLTSEDLYQLLTKSEIISGIDYKQLHLVRECIRKGYTDTDFIVVARGKKTVPGKNAHLKYKLEIGPIAGELLKDGSIDFRERKIMVPVSAGQIIAVKVPATDGIAGMTVLGERLPPQPGSDLVIKTSDEAFFSPETNQVTATSDGVLSIVKDNVIKVSSKQEIPGDIDYSTGNIESRSCVVIHGSVLPGFRVRTGGDLEIRGSVMSTQVTSLANIVIKGGITGSSSLVTAFGDVDIHFIEQGNIHCDGNCIIRRQCYYSHIASGGSIRCKEHSALVGGELIAEGHITLGDAGATGADPVFLAAGVVAERLFQQRKLKQQLEAHKESIIERLKGYSGMARTKKLRSIKSGIERIKLQHLRINMIPKTGIYSRPNEDIERTQPTGPGDQNSQQDAGIFDIRTISIDVYGTIFSGTFLQIGNRTLTVERTLSRRRFKLDENQNHIISTGLS